MKDVTKLLFEFVESGNLDGVRVLIQLGIDIDVVDELGRTPLTVAAAKGYLGIVKNLISAGSDVNLKA